MGGDKVVSTPLLMAFYECATAVASVQPDSDEAKALLCESRLSDVWEYKTQGETAEAIRYKTESGKKSRFVSRLIKDYGPLVKQGHELRHLISKSEHEISANCNGETVT